MSRGRRRRKPDERGRVPSPQSVDVDPEELRAIVDRAQQQPLSSDEHTKLAALIDTLVFLTEELRASGASIERLRRLLFGTKSETTQDVLGALAAPQTQPDPAAPQTRPKPPGHGRHAATTYLAAAEKVAVPHPTVHQGDLCPECARGRVRPTPEPVRVVRFRGIAPLQIRLYEKERLRCASCGEVFTAPSPEGVGDKKYDETATAMVALMKYGSGLPFNRIEKLHAGLGIPLPASTQWEVVRDGAELLAAPHEELLRQAAQSQVLYNDDTTAKILDLTPKERAEALSLEKADERTGVFTSGIVATGEDHKIAVFCTGVRHAGENLADVLRRRQQQLPHPIQMCDGSANNTCGDFAAILGNCLAHARRKYVEVVDNFPAECAHVLKLLGQVYAHDAEAKKLDLAADERLALHQQKSAPLMDELQQWGRQQIAEHKIEPHSGLGAAIAYMQRRWDALTLFLRQPGAPLDSNLVERALKKAILHRKNSLFFKSTKGARVADLYMSLIHTCELNRANPFDYLVTLLRHHRAVAHAPADWMPWTYLAALENLHRGP
ncbi:MAG TPA: IS66 family transposase [Thermoanaerobaculia bacterium]|nr:IS66 family transposase [Thermoanaerobaculia bacterium]